MTWNKRCGRSSVCPGSRYQLGRPTDPGREREGRRVSFRVPPSRSPFFLGVGEVTDAPPPTASPDTGVPSIRHLGGVATSVSFVSPHDLSPSVLADDPERPEWRPLAHPSGRRSGVGVRGITSQLWGCGKGSPVSIRRLSDDLASFVFRVL